MGIKKMSFASAILRAVSVFICLLIAGLAPAQVSTDRVHLDIPAQSLSTALTQFGRDTGTEIVFTPNAVAQKMSAAVKGEFLREKAIALLLSGTGLTYRVTAQGAIVIDIAPAPKSSAATATPSDTSTHLAQSTSASTQSQVGPDAVKNANSPDSGPKDTRTPGLDEIVVTGTNITGVENKTVPLLTFDRAAIERSGYATTADFIDSLPQNVKSGANSADGILLGGAGVNNAENSTAANLRGLGAGSTLTLLNGHRLAAAAFGTGVDLSMIPLSAVERIEVLTDGSSAVYGSDAVGGVVNIILRKDFNGAETSARFDTLSRGGGETKLVGQSLGKTWSTGGALVVVEFQDANAIHADQRSFTANLPEPTDIYPTSKRYSGVLSGHQSLTDSLELFADALLEHDATYRAWNLGGADPQVQLMNIKSDSQSVNVGLRWQPFGDWHLEADTLFSQLNTFAIENFSPALPGYTNGDPFLRNLATTKEADLKLDGTLWASGGSSVKAAAGASYRREDFNELSYYLDGQVNSFGRRVSAAFAELYAPLISASNAIMLVKKLEFSAAVRKDSYSDFGAKTDPRFGVFWAPLDEVGIRAAFSTSFRAPNPYEQLTASSASTAYAIGPYPLPNGTSGNVLAFGNQTLNPETSHNLTLGADYQPVAVPGTRLTVNYFRIDYSNRITQSPFGPTVFTNPQVYGPLIQQFSSDAAAAAFLASLNPPQTLFDATAAGTGLTGVRYGFPYGDLNATKQITEGFDLGGDSVVSLAGNNKLIFNLNATYLMEIKSTFCSTCTSTEQLNVYGQPLKLRVRAAAGWSNGIWTANAAANHSNAYTDTNILPYGRISSFTTTDINANCRLPLSLPTTIGLNVTNLFNANPPGTAPAFNNLAYDPVNADPRGRIVSLQVHTQW
jgi:iron complex outermembrane recepter protein